MKRQFIGVDNTLQINRMSLHDLGCYFPKFLSETGGWMKLPNESKWRCSTGVNWEHNHILHCTGRILWLPKYLRPTWKYTLMHDIYAINILPRQLPYSHDVSFCIHMMYVCVYGFNGGRPGTAYAPHTLRNMPLLVGLAKCGHAAKTLAMRERHDDFITFLGIPLKLDHVWHLASFFSPYTVRQCL